MKGRELELREAMHYVNTYYPNVLCGGESCVAHENRYPDTRRVTTFPST